MVDPSTVDGGLVVETDVMVPMRDGVRLRTDVYRPAPTGRYPVLVTRTPYHPAMSAGGVANDPNVGLAQLGFAVVCQHCRGRFGSEGDFRFVEDDVNDGFDAIEWAACQPWSNGKVAMIGASYSGMTQWAAALARPPHLVAITPATCPWSYTDSIPFVSPGVLALDIALAWTGFVARNVAEQHGRLEGPLAEMPTPDEVGTALGLGHGAQAILDIASSMRRALLPLVSDHPIRDLALFREVAPWWARFMDSPLPDAPYWRAFAPAVRPGDVTVPALIVTGWYDQFLPAGLDAFTALREHGGGGPAVRDGHRLVIGFWGHGTPGERVAGHLADVDPSGGELAAGAATVNFLGHWLRDQPPTEDDAPIRLFVIGPNTWRGEREWPLARTHWTEWYLHSAGGANTRGGDGTLSPDAPVDEEPDEFLFDPADPVPQRGGPVVTLMSLPGPGPFDQGPIEDRQDVLVYTSEPFDTEVEITGPVSLRLWAASSAEATDFTAKLVDVFPDGTAVNLCQGVVRTRFAGRDRTSLSGGGPWALEVDLAATSTVIMPGHRVRLEISSSCFPSYDVNPNTGRNLFDDATNETMVAHQFVFHNAARPSHLILPVIPDEVGGAS